MAEIIKLNAKRKQRAFNEKETLAQNNRVKFGRTKVEKNLAKAKEQQRKKLLDDHKLSD